MHTNEIGVQVETYNEYGCCCRNENENNLGIYYRSRTKELFFFRNGINQGLAFRNVPNNLIPSIDIWFPYGTVEVIETRAPKLKTFSK